MLAESMKAMLRKVYAEEELKILFPHDFKPRKDSNVTQVATTSVPAKAPNVMSEDQAARLRSEMEILRKQITKGNNPNEAKWNDLVLRREGLEVVVPEECPLQTVVQFLNKKIVEENSVVAVNEEFQDVYPFDGAIALSKALNSMFGWVSNEATPGFWRDAPPTFVTIQTGPGWDEKQSLPWSRFSVMNIDGWLAPGVNQNGKFPYFILRGEVKYRDLPLVRKLATEIRRIAAHESIYRGKAIKVDFSWKDDEEGFDMDQHSPRFIPVAGYEPDGLILPRHAQNQINHALFARLTGRERLKKHRVPIKQGVLLYGPFGTGKTLTGNVAANIATQNGWTFIYLPDVSYLSEALQMARHYQPAVVFVEDVDEAVKAGRTSGVNQVLNTIDGIEMKDAEIITIMTTNSVDVIEPAMLRPGRIDAVIEIPVLDAESAIRCIKLYGRSTLDPDADWTEVGRELAGLIPANIRKVVEDAKTYAIVNSPDGNITHQLRPEHLSAAVATVLAQDRIRQANMERSKPRDPMAVIGSAAGVAVAETIVSAQRAFIQTHGDTEPRALENAGAGTGA